MDTPDTKKNEDEPDDSDPLTVKPIHTDKSDLPQTEYMKAGIINKFPSMLLVVGRSGSGKSTVCNYIVTTPQFYGDFFDQTWLFSPTAEHDDLSKHLKLEKKYMVTKPSEEKLEEILTKQDALIKSKGIKWCGQHSKVLIIFDDIVSHKKFLDSPAFLRLATMGRHSLISSIINVQSYTKCPRGVRLQANGVILFPSNQNEVGLLVDDHCPPNKSKKQFRQLVDHATHEKHSFLYIHCPSEPEQRFRRKFGSYLTMD